MKLKEYFKQQYQGHTSFLENVIFPIFGEDNFEDGYEEDVLENNPQLKTEASNVGIEGIMRVGNILIDFNPILIFDISVTDHVRLSRNRVGVQHIIRRIMDTFSSAFMIFHYDDQSMWDWRFSFCRKGSGNEDSTESKRYTFLLGPNQSCRTAAENFEKLAELGGNIEANDIVKAFDVEALSNEFFDKYTSHYEDFVEYITGKRFVKKGSKWEEKSFHDPHPQMYADFGHNDKLVRDYVKKLLGRIVFLHFLQKKGWLGVPQGKEWGEGDMQFMLHLFEQSTDEQKEDFLDTVLEPLFTAIDTDRTTNYDLYNTGVALDGGSTVRIPYLNGGLFERDSLDEITTKFPSDYFAKLLDFFYQYNFTIDENDPNDAQVGVDPEMLGRIFENLLEDNKDKGAYYTPKEIVRYMCRQSLTAYLQTDITDENQKKAIEEFVRTYDVELLGGADSELALYIDEQLKDVKICDPAIGSGAFPMGLLRELFLCRGAIENFDNAADIKRHIIQQNIYGVDIERGAVDIARLRFWLSLIVDEETPDCLPNLDYKIMQGNSLLEQYQGIDLSKLAKSKAEILNDKQQLNFFDDIVDVYRRDLRHKIDSYYSEPDHARKHQLVREIHDNILAQMKEQSIDLDLSNIDIQSNDQFFLWHTWFADVLNRPSPCNGFDIVIGNPPYISAPAQVANPVLSKQREDVTACGRFNSLYQKWDIYVPFIEQGLLMLAPNGVLSMIVPYPLTNQNYGKLLRQMLLSDYTLMELADLNGTKIFENATVSNCIPFVRHKKMCDGDKVSISHIDENRAIHRNYFLTANQLMPRTNTKLVYCLDEPQSADDTLTRFSYMPVLGDICYISVGMVLNADEKTAKGQFCKDDLISDTEDAVHCRRYIEAKDIERYRIKRVRWLEYNTHRCPDQLRRPTFRELYEKEKLVMNCLGGVSACMDEARLLHNHSIYCAVPWHLLSDVTNKSILASVKRYSRLSRVDMENLSSQFDLAYLLGVMNSRMAAYLLENLRGGDYHIYPEHLRNIPIPKATIEQQTVISTLSTQILSLKQASSDTDTTVLEQKIDCLVYKLYGLTYDEVRIVDPQTDITEEEYNKE